VISLLAFLHLKLANNSCLNRCNYATLWLPKWSNKNCWRSIDAHLRDILTVIGCAIILLKIHTFIFDSQYTVSRYNHLHPKASMFVSFWATTYHVISLINDVAPWCFGAFSQYVTAYRARFRELLFSSSFSSISMMYHKQFSNSWPCTVGLSPEICS